MEAKAGQHGRHSFEKWISFVEFDLLSGNCAVERIRAGAWIALKSVVKGEIRIAVAS